jgi:hypothetical protein
LEREKEIHSDIFREKKDQRNQRNQGRFIAKEIEGGFT